MTTSSPTTRLAGVRKSFRERLVLAGVDLSVHAGEVVALIGHNGSGKTTLLRILGTTVLPDAGSVEVAGIDALSEPLAARRELGVTLADERAWYWRLTGRENLEFFGALHGLSRQAAAAKTDELLERVSMSEAADRPFGEYSSGMRLRLSLARALFGDPQLLLLDEPTRSIDPTGATEFHETIRRQVQDTGAAVLMASHDLVEVCELADRALLLQAGQTPQLIEPPLDPEALRHSLAEAR